MIVHLCAKLAGGLCLLGCGWLAGNEKVKRLFERRVLLEELCDFLQQMEENLTYRLDPVDRVLENLRQRSYRVLRLPKLQSRTLPEWEQEFLSALSQLRYLEQEELGQLKLLFETMGSASAQEEIQKLRGCTVALQRPLAAARQAEREGKRLYRTLGLAAAAAAALVLF